MNTLGDYSHYFGGFFCFPFVDRHHIFFLRDFLSLMFLIERHLSFLRNDQQFFCIVCVVFSVFFFLVDRHKSLLWATIFSKSILLSLLFFSRRQTTVSAQCSGMSNECAVWAGRKCKWFAIYDIWLASLGKFLKTSITWVLLLLFQKGSEHMKCILERLRL